jgi:hypothetical protein
MITSRETVSKIQPHFTQTGQPLEACLSHLPHYCCRYAKVNTLPAHFPTNNHVEMSQRSKQMCIIE